MINKKSTSIWVNSMPNVQLSVNFPWDDVYHVDIGCILCLSAKHSFNVHLFTHFSSFMEPNAFNKPGILVSQMISNLFTISWLNNSEKKTWTTKKASLSIIDTLVISIKITAKISCWILQLRYWNNRNKILAPLRKNLLEHLKLKQVGL